MNFKSFDNPGRIVGFSDTTDLLELAFRHLRAHEMSDQDAMLFLNQFSAGQGRDIGWRDEARVLPRQIAERIDRAANGWIMITRLSQQSDARTCGISPAESSLDETLARDFKMRAAGGE